MDPRLFHEKIDMSLSSFASMRGKAITDVACDPELSDEAKKTKIWREIEQLVDGNGGFQTD